MNITYKRIMRYKPCYDPQEVGMPKNYSDTVLNFIKEYRTKAKSLNDIFWVVCREKLIDVKTLRLFACWCAREALKLVKNPDDRSINAVNVAEKFANGEATQAELAVAWDAACDAAWDAGVAAWDAACDAAGDAAWDAAWDAAGDAAGDAAWDAACDAAGDAARAAAWDAAWDAARNEQIDKLVEMLEANILNI